MRDDRTILRDVTPLGLGEIEAECVRTVTVLFVDERKRSRVIMLRTSQAAGELLDLIERKHDLLVVGTRFDEGFIDGVLCHAGECAGRV